jgi:DNA-binding response OmpR family regulator
VLVVDDQAGVRRVVARALGDAGYEVAEAADGATALAMLTADPPDLVVLDLSLPRVAGLDVLTRLRSTSDVPVIILTGRGADAERIVGLDLGADDYVVKPFSPLELAARVRSLLRRTARGTSERLVFGPLTIELGTRDVSVEGEPVELTVKEFDLLAFLAASPRRVFSREHLLQEVWSSSSEWQDPGTVTQHIHRLRRKIEPDPGRPRWLHAVRGIGYRFEP